MTWIEPYSYTRTALLREFRQSPESRWQWWARMLAVSYSACTLLAGLALVWAPALIIPPMVFAAPAVTVGGIGLVAVIFLFLPRQVWVHENYVAWSGGQTKHVIGLRMLREVDILENAGLPELRIRFIAPNGDLREKVLAIGTKVDIARLEERVEEVRDRIPDLASYGHADRPKA